MAFGNIGHLPPYDTIPDEFRRHGGNAYCKFVSDWFFGSLTEKDIARLGPRDGVDKGKALAAIRCILASWAPAHEHKEAGAAYLLSCWFELGAA
jgi:hypothetical protein